MVDRVAMEMIESSGPQRCRVEWEGNITLEDSWCRADVVLAPLRTSTKVGAEYAAEKDCRHGTELLP